MGHGTIDPSASDAGCWEVARDVMEVHELLCACDAYLATPSVPAPRRNLATTAIRVAESAVHLLRCDAMPIAMFTFTLEPPFEDRYSNWPKARRPAYISRLTVNPRNFARGTILGLRCYRRAFELAAEQDVDVVRLEANPDLDRVGELLRMLGFECYGSCVGDDGLKRVYCQKNLA